MWEGRKGSRYVDGDGMGMGVEGREEEGRREGREKVEESCENEFEWVLRE